MQVTFVLALFAGLVSFLSPCVLPLVPAYIGYLGGRVTNTVAAQTAGGAAIALKPSVGSRFSTMLHGLAFVAGFTFVFVAIGLLGTAFVSVIGRQSINTVTAIIGRGGGILIIFFGLHFMGILPSVFNILLGRRSLINSPFLSAFIAVIVVTLLFWVFADWLLAAPIFALIALGLVLGGAFSAPADFWTKVILWLQRTLYADTRREMVAQGHQSYAGSAIMGVIFSAGWTPCIGPIYGTILTMAAAGADVATAGWLLLAYSLGLGIPFVAAAFLLDGAQGILRHLQRHLHKIELISGAFLVLIGVLVASGRLQDLSQNFATQFSDFSYQLENCLQQVNAGEISVGDYFGCISASPDQTTTTAAPVATATSEAPLASVPSILDLAADAAPAPAVGLNIGDSAPNFSATTDSGAAFSLADLRGSVVLLNFWATWCGPCRIEMPQFQKAYTDKADQGFAIIGVNDAETLEDITGFRAEFGLTFPLLLDEDARVQDLYAVRSYPSTYVLDPDGKIIALHFGPLTAAQIDTLVNEALS